MSDRKRPPIVYKAALKRHNGGPEHQLLTVSHSIFWWLSAPIHSPKIVVESLGRALAKRRWCIALARRVFLRFPTLRERIRKAIATGPRPDHASSGGIKMIAAAVRRWIAALAKRGLSPFPTLRRRIKKVIATGSQLVDASSTLIRSAPYDDDTYKALIVASKKWNFRKRLDGK